MFFLLMGVMLQACRPVNFRSSFQGQKKPKNADYVQNKISENQFDRNPLDAQSPSWVSPFVVSVYRYPLYLLYIFRLSSSTFILL